MRNPSILRYVECELPSAVEKAIADFEDDFDDRLKPFYDRLDEFKINELPGILEDLEEQIEIRDQLLKGAPVQELDSLAAVDENVRLTNPQREYDAPETVRLDEQKLGAANICLLKGKMYKMLSSNRLDALRYLWEAAAGDYDYFVLLGTSVFSLPENTYVLYEYKEHNKYDTIRILPWMNKGFIQLEEDGYFNSQYRHRMLWNKGIGATYGLKTKMTALGYDSDQINNIFSGEQPNGNMEEADKEVLDGIAELIRSVTRLLLLPEDDEQRNPLWKNEASHIMLAIKAFLEYRLRKHTNSSIFDPDYWLLFLDAFRPSDIHELLVYRPEIKNIELPQDVESITTLVEQATAIPAESSIINTYMVNILGTDREEKDLTQTLYDLGLFIWKSMHKYAKDEERRLNAEEAADLAALAATDPNDPVALAKVLKENSLAEVLRVEAARKKNDRLKQADDLEAYLLELDEKPGPLTEESPYYDLEVSLSPEDITSAFPPGTNMPPAGGTDIKDASRGVKASAITDRYARRVGDDSGRTQGLPSVETFSMILQRRVSWAENFLDCSGALFGATPGAPDQELV